MSAKAKLSKGRMGWRSVRLMVEVEVVSSMIARIKKAAPLHSDGAAFEFQNITM
jgi:hypothetical protein